MSEQDIDKVMTFSGTYFDDNPDEQYPSRWFIVNAFGEMVFFLVRDRKKAETILCTLYGSKYALRSTHSTNQNKPKTAVGTETRSKKR